MWNIRAWTDKIHWGWFLLNTKPSKHGHIQSYLKLFKFSAHDKCSYCAEVDAVEHIMTRKKNGHTKIWKFS